MNSARTYSSEQEQQQLLQAVQTVNGCWPVMLTPYAANGRIDFDALDALVEWYIAGGCQGLFASCLSSDMFDLSRSERLQLVQRVVARVGGRVPVIASGAFAPGVTAEDATGRPADIADAAHRLADTGVAAVIFTTNQFGGPGESEAQWLNNLEATLTRTDPTLVLGLYECPTPYKRLLSPEILGWIIRTGLFRFLKDTCCDLQQIRSKLRLLDGSVLRFYNAHTATLLASLQAGGSGFSGVGANAVPHLYAWLCNNFATQPQLATQLQAFLAQSAPVVDTIYPGAVKTYLQLYGVPVTPVSRMAAHAINQDEELIRQLHAFHDSVTDWEQQLGLASPFTPFQ